MTYQAGFIAFLGYLILFHKFLYVSFKFGEIPQIEWISSQNFKLIFVTTQLNALKIKSYQNNLIIMIAFV